MRIENNGPVYSSFVEYAKANNVEPKSKVNNDTNIADRQKKFSAYHKCKACGKPMQFKGSTNVMCCTNQSCRGIKHIRKDKDGNDVISYVPSYDILEDKYADIAMNLFA